MYTLPVYEIKAIGNVKGAMFAPKSNTESIPNDENPLVANEHKRVIVSKIARTEMKFERMSHQYCPIFLLVRGTPCNSFIQ